MHDFDYSAPATLAEAIEQMSKHNGSAKPLAGGTDLIDQIRTGRLAPEILIDLKRLPELNVLESGREGLRVGAATPCWRIQEAPTVSEQYSALADCCRIIGGIQIQSRASFGGNLCNSGPAADSVPAMIALRGVCLIAGSKGTREIPVESFCTGPGENVLQAGELLVEVRFPARPAHSGSHYRRMIPRNEMDIAVVGVGASVVLDERHETFQEVRIALGAVAPTPLLAEEAGERLAGQPVNAESIALAVDAARSLAAPITDMRGTREYRIHATGVLVRRVLEAAVARARGASIGYQVGR